MPTALDSIVIHDAQRYVDHGYPWREWDALRREAPVYWYERSDIEPFWAITKHADVLAISRNAKTFINGGPRLRLASFEGEQMMREGFKGFARQRGWDPDEPPDMVFMDDPRHRQFRLLTSSAFTPGRLRDLVPRLEKIAQEFATEFAETLRQQTAETGRCDFVREYSIKLPLAAIGDLMGLPHGDWMKVLIWSNALLGDIHPTFEIEGEPPWGATRRAVDEMRDYFDELMAERRAAGADSASLVDMLLRGRIDGEPLTDQQLHGYLLLLTAAGNETTRNATTGGVLALLEHPDQRDLLCARPELVDSAVEEILRWTSPVVQFARTAVEDVEIRGQKIRAGETVGMFYPSANRDEDAFDDPYRFDVARAPNHHLAFGHGAHFCMGANLARVELRAAIRALLPILPHMELVDAGARLPNLHVPGYRSLGVRSTQEKR
jgi:cholest-4-en-3-one 26-monooxygenase